MEPGTIFSTAQLLQGSAEFVWQDSSACRQMMVMEGKMKKTCRILMSNDIGWLLKN